MASKILGLGISSLTDPTTVGIREDTRLIIYKPQETSPFPFLPRVPCFSLNDRVVLVRNAYGLRAISGGIACGQQGIGSVNKEPLLDNTKNAVLGIFMKD